MQLKQTNTGTEELTGKFFKSIYKSNDKTYCVSLYTVNHGKDTVTVVGNNLPEVNYAVTFSGQWVVTQKFGRQFKADMVVKQLPVAKRDIINYIASMKIGIGKKTAEKMLDFVGMERFWEVLRNDPMQFRDIPGVKQESIALLQRKISEQSAQQEVFQLFAGDLSCDSKQFKKICAFFKGNTVQMLESIRENPFVLMKCGYTFEELDYYSSRHTAFPVNDYRRLLAATQQALLNAKESSHVCLPEDLLVQETSKLLNKQGFLPKEEILAFLPGASGAGEIILSNGKYYLPRYYKEEVKIAEIINQLVGKKNTPVSKKKFDTMMEEYTKMKGFTLSSDQQNAILTALQKSICIITGGPGTGKSTILDALLYCWKQLHDDQWLLMAPTGKAAVRMSETTAQSATTIHSTLGLNVGNEDTDELDEWAYPIEASLVVVDETSMLDQTVMASLLMALSHTDSKRIQHLVLVGDPDQLPSVGPGNILADCIHSGVIQVCRLKTIYRQGAENPIITNSAKMLAGDTNLLWDRAFRRYHVGTDEENMAAACKFYLRCVNQFGPENVVILSPYHKATAISTNIINKTLQEAINPSQGQGEITVFGRIYRTGDRVMQLRNTDSLSNGDIGTIVYVNPRAGDTDVCATVKFENGTTVEYIREALVQLEHAWAISVHKSQGSQYRVVILMLPNQPSSFLRRNILYTAITRSQENVAIFGPTRVIEHCIQNDKQDLRYTNLISRLTI